MKYKPENNWNPDKGLETFKTNRNITREKKIFLMKIKKKSTKTFKTVLSFLSDYEIDKFRYSYHHFENIIKSSNIDEIVDILENKHILLDNKGKIIKRKIIINNLLT